MRRTRLKVFTFALLAAAVFFSCSHRVIVCLKRVYTAKCDWVPLQQTYDLNRIVEFMDSRRRLDAASSQLSFSIASCGVRTTATRSIVVQEQSDGVRFELQLAYDGNRYFAHVAGGGECRITEGDVRTNADHLLDLLPITDKARSELRGVFTVETHQTAKWVSDWTFF